MFHFPEPLGSCKSSIFTMILSLFFYLRYITIFKKPLQTERTPTVYITFFSSCFSPKVAVNIMQRNITAMQRRTGPSTTAQASWYSQPVPKSQNAVAFTMKKNHVQLFGQADDQQRINFPRSPYPSPPRSEEVRCYDQNSIYHSSRTQGINDCSTIPYLPSSTMKVQEPLNGEHDITDNNTTSSPSSTSSAITLVNGTSHTHLDPNTTHTQQPIPAPPPFSIRQTFSAYPNIDLFDESLKRNRSSYSMHNLAQEVKDKIPDTGRVGVRLQDPAALLRSRLLERRRKKRNTLTFSKTALLHVYDQAEICRRDKKVRNSTTAGMRIVGARGRGTGRRNGIVSWIGFFGTRLIKLVRRGGDMIV